MLYTTLLCVCTLSQIKDHFDFEGFFTSVIRRPIAQCTFLIRRFDVIYVPLCLGKNKFFLAQGQSKIVGRRR
jgi:hypothetical protein